MRYRVDAPSPRTNGTAERREGRFGQSLKAGEKKGRKGGDGMKPSSGRPGISRSDVGASRSDGLAVRYGTKGDGDKATAKAPGDGSSKAGPTRGADRGSPGGVSSQTVKGPGTPGQSRTIGFPRQVGMTGGNDPTVPRAFAEGGNAGRGIALRVGPDGPASGELGAGTVRADVPDGMARPSRPASDAGHAGDMDASALPETQAAQDGFVPAVMRGMAFGRTAADDASAIVCFLEPNDLDATEVILKADGRGAIMGDGVEIVLSGGGFDASGGWMATHGSGRAQGRAVTLVPDADGIAFAFALIGSERLAEIVEARLDDGTVLRAGVIAVAQP